MASQQLNLMSLEELEPMVSQKLGTYHFTEDYPDQDRTVTFLQALFELAPTSAGQHNIAVDILACTTSECLKKLADRYVERLIKPIRAGGRTPPVSDHPSRDSANLEATNNSYLVEPAKPGDRSTMRDLVLRRENYRCILTGKIHHAAIETGKTKRQPDEFMTAVDNAHILPFSLMPSGNENSRTQPGAVWQVLSAFSGIPREELTEVKINRPENGLALDHMFHTMFGGLSICFEETEELDTYRILSWTMEDYRLPETVSFVSRSNIPVPDPRYLALHAACAKVVHQSGMAEILDKLIEDLERTDVLSSDGSSANLLHHALMMAAV